MTQANFMGGLLQGLSQGLLTFGEVKRQEEKRKKTEKALKSIAELMAEGITPQLGSAQEAQAFESAPFESIGAEGTTQPADLSDLLANADIMASPELATMLIGEQLKTQRTAQQGQQSQALLESALGGTAPGTTGGANILKGVNIAQGQPQFSVGPEKTRTISWVSPDGTKWEQDVGEFTGTPRGNPRQAGLSELDQPMTAAEREAFRGPGGELPPVGISPRDIQAGGPFRQVPSEQRKAVTPEQAGKIQNVDLGIEAVETMRTQLLTKDGGLAPGARIALAQMEANIPFTRGRQLRSDSLTAIDAIVRARTGATMNESEKVDTYRELVPSALDDDKTIVAKLNKLEAFLGGQLDVITLPPRIAKVMRQKGGASETITIDFADLPP